MCCELRSKVLGYSGLSVEEKPIRVRGQRNGLRKGWVLGTAFLMRGHLSRDQQEVQGRGTLPAGKSPQEAEGRANSRTLNPKQGAALMSEASGREAGVTDANKQMNQKVVEDEAEKETCMPSGGLHSKIERFEHANDVI